MKKGNKTTTHPGLPVLNPSVPEENQTNQKIQTGNQKDDITRKEIEGEIFYREGRYDEAWRAPKSWHHDITGRSLLSITHNTRTTADDPLAGPRGR